MALPYDDGFDPKDFSVRISDMLVATADASDAMIDQAVTEMLALLRQRLAMDVVFVSEFVDGRRVFRQVKGPAGSPLMSAGDSDPLEETWCQRVVDGRMPQFVPDVQQLPDKDSLPKAPFPIGTHLSTPIVLDNGQVYGTLCCLSFSPNLNIRERDMKNLQSMAALVARKVDKSPDKRYAATEPAPLTLQPKR